LHEAERGIVETFGENTGDSLVIQTLLCLNGLRDFVFWRQSDL
jgi:hypothetical protein